jgi:DNA-binding response OmpR family regulator
MAGVNAMPIRILIVEDDALFRDSLCEILNLEGFSANGVASIAAYQSWIQSHECDVMILDRNLGDGDGLTVLSLQKQIKPVPTIFVTCEGQPEDRVLGLNADADYYLVKPIVTDELVAILRKFERRINLTSVDTQSWLLDKERWRLVWPHGVHYIPLTRSEMALLLCFANKAGVLVSRNEIAQALGSDPLVYDFRRLEVMIRRLRSKASNPAAIEMPLGTAYGKGYVFNGELVITQ